MLALAVLGPMATGDGRALASHLVCGDTITVDTKLHADLVNCPNNGIVIGADGITLDLNGHTITGDGEPVAQCPADNFCDVGLLNDDHDGVTVRNGSVRAFGVGVLVGRARYGRVLAIASSGNQFFGIAVTESARIVVRDSSSSRNVAPDGDGMGLFGSHHVRVLDSSFRRNAGPHLHVVDSTYNVVKGNLFADNPAIGVLIEGDRNQVRRNRCVRNGGCIIVAPGSRNVIARNRIFRGGAGIGIEKGRGNLVIGNVSVDARITGIYLGLDEPPIGGARNVVRGNLVRGSGRDAYRVSRHDRRSRLQGNIAKGSGDDGFDVASRSARLADNRAVRNDDLGIEGVRGVIDRGGNSARRNGDPRQCTHIRCR